MCRSSNSANVLRALAHGGSPDKSAGLVDSVTDGGPGSPFLSAYSPVSGAASAVVEDSRKGLEKEVSLLSRLLEEEKLQSRKAGDRIEQLQFEKQEAVAQSKNLQRLLKESLEQLDSRRMAVSSHDLVLRMRVSLLCYLCPVSFDCPVG